MFEFLKSITEWSLQKEEELAKKCVIPTQEIDKQIKKVEDKIKELEEEYEKNKRELEEILVKLKWIKVEALKCSKEQVDKDDK